MTSQPVPAHKIPWPEPSPISATEMPPGVLKIPLAEHLDFIWHVWLRYIRQILTYWPVAMAKGLRSPYPEPVSDDEFCRLMYDTCMSKLLYEHLDPVDLQRFGSVLATLDGKRLIKADFSGFAELTVRKGEYAAPTVSLFERDAAGRPQLRAIAVRDVVLTPTSGQAWELAKVFALQGASQHMVNCHHIPLHFPLDTINAITKSALPVDHIVRQFIGVHSRFSLPLNDAALHSQMSVLRNRDIFIYCPFAVDQQSIYRLAQMGYGGIPGNSAYPRWQYSPYPDPILGDYGVFLERYYTAILEFTKEIAAAVPANDPHVRDWANAIAGFLPAFPDGDAIREGDLLARVLARFVWSATVAHAADHYDYGEIPIERIPLRLRVPAPVSAGAAVPPTSEWGRWTDAMRHEMARVLFFKEDTVVRLIDTRYTFPSPALNAAGERFIARLHEVDATMPVRRFIPLEKIPASIQF